jgi:translation elongation factor EF-Ts
MIRRLINKNYFTIKANLELLKKIREETSAPIGQIKTALEES